MTDGHSRRGAFRFFVFLPAALVWAAAACSYNHERPPAESAAHPEALEQVSVADRIQPYPGNPFYWQYKGRPVLLLGGSRQDNLFNHPEGLAEHLDTLRAAGGNYIRNTMSSRNPGNPWPFRKLENGLYDLEQWDEEYWKRLENLLMLSLERDVILQIEVWDPWDYFKSEAPLGFGPENVGWESCPYNPALNVNYTAEESGLAEEIDYYSRATPTDHLFFHTPPELKDTPLVRRYQEAFVDKLLSVSLNYPNVLYCMNNEIGEPPEWGRYWARYIRARAEQEGIPVFLADMRRNSDFQSEEQLNLLHDREHFDFFEISQNTANNDQRHYEMIQSIRLRVQEAPIPLNNVKIYGGEIGSWTTSVEEGTRRFWRNIFGGLASSRFHREGPSPHYFGIGLSELARTHIRSMRMLTDELQVFQGEPRNDLLSEREPNEAYCFAVEGRSYAVYFTNGSAVRLALPERENGWRVRWLNVLESRWETEATLAGGQDNRLSPPGAEQWAALVVPAG